MNSMDQAKNISLRNDLRIETAIQCHDCDGIPKVSGAGELCGDNNQYQVMHNGLIIKRGGYYDEWMTEIIRRLKGHHEPQEEKVFSEVLFHLAPGSCMLELGSFWAYYSMWFLQSIPNSVSIMVEPNPEKLALGKEHFALNNLNGKFIQGFVGADSNPDAKFTDWDKKIYRIRQVSVDELMKEFNLDHLDILHADVQGAEYDMLHGATHALSTNSISYLFISTHGFEHGRCMQLLREFNYNIIAEHSILESYSGDGLIVACSPDCMGPSHVSISHRQPALGERLHYKLAFLKHKLSQFLKQVN